jgi:hypothetical protein
MNDLLHAASRLFDHAASVRERRELSERIASDPRFAEQFAMLAVLHRRLQVVHRAMTPIAARPRRIATRPALSLRVFAAAAALVLGIGLLTAVLLTMSGRAHRPGPITSGGPVAVLMAADGVTWASADGATHAGAAMKPGKYEITAGQVTIDFYSGASATIEAPAQFALNSPMRAHLEHGRMSVHVPKQARGFTVAAPGVAVVDLGTRFHMTVDRSGGSQVRVDEGSVEVHTEGASSPTVLANRQSARLVPGRLVEVHIQPETIASAAGIRTTGAVQLALTVPESLALNAFEADGRITLLPERGEVTLPRDMVATITEPGRYTRFDRAAVLPAGRRVKSYLLHFDPVQRGTPSNLPNVAGSITFDRPIVGVIAETQQINAADALFGRGEVQYATDYNGFGLEDDQGDVLSLSEDRRTLHVRMSAHGVDQVRVLVADDND